MTDEPTTGELTVKEAAQLAGTKEKNIRHAITRGRIKARIVLTQGAKAEYRIDEESFNAWRRSLNRPLTSPDDWQGRTSRIHAGA